MNIRKIIEAEASKVLKEKLIGKKVSVSKKYKVAKINDDGKYEIVDVLVSIEEKCFLYSDRDYDYYTTDYDDVTVNIVTEALKTRKKGFFTLDLDDDI